MDAEITAENRREYLLAYLPEIAMQCRDGDLITYMEFNGWGLQYDVGFSTDISQSCIWITPWVLEPFDNSTTRCDDVV